MTALPIVVRELRVASRRRSTYHMRFWTASVAAAICGYMALGTGRVFGGAKGHAVFTVLVSLCFVSCLTLAANTVDCVSEEKREGTLGFLFLTDLKGHDIALGKLFSSSLISFYSLLGVIPVGALTLVLGGVSPAEVALASLALLNAFFLSQAVGLFVSTVTIKRNTGTTLAGLILLFYTLGLFLLAQWLNETRFRAWSTPIEWFNPAYGLYWACRITFSPGGTTMLLRDYWISFAITQVSAWAYLAAASLWLPHSWQEKKSRVKARLGEKFRLWYHSKFTPRSRLLDQNAFLWLTTRNTLGSLMIWTVLAVVNSFWVWLLFKIDHRDSLMALFGAAIVLNHLILKILFTSSAVTGLEEQRYNGGLELLLCCTPLSTAEILRGQWLALQRFYLKPTLIILASDAVMMVTVIGHSRLPRGEDLGSFVMFVMAVMVMLVADLFALGWVGMWKAMSQRKRRHASGAAISQILFLPWVILWLLMMPLAWGGFGGTGEFLALWFIIGFGVDGVAAVRARNNLEKQFRTLAAVHSAEPLGFFGKLGRALGRVAREHLKEG